MAVRDYRSGSLRLGKPPTLGGVIPDAEVLDWIKRRKRSVGGGPPFSLCFLTEDSMSSCPMFPPLCLPDHSGPHPHTVHQK